MADHLTDKQQLFVDQIKTHLSIIADLSRADTLLYGPLVAGKTKVLAHEQPHSVAPVYLHDRTNQLMIASEVPLVVKALRTGRIQRGVSTKDSFGDGAMVRIKVLPIPCPDTKKQILGAVSINLSLIEYERHRRRSPVFRKALRQLHHMLIKGQLTNAESLSQFGEHEGLVVLDKQGFIRYTSGIAANLYRKLGYVGGLMGINIENLATHDDHIARQTMINLVCVEEETESGGRSWVRKSLPILEEPNFFEKIWRIFTRSSLTDNLVGVVLVLRDKTEELRKEQEIRMKNIMIQEIHHRVKNNLQTIAALLRIQSRRVTDEDALTVMQDGINRILSVAVIHEFLSEQGTWAINMKEVFQRIITQSKQSIVPLEKAITFSLDGPSIWLPARQATACALIINEFLQNAVEHGFQEMDQGQIAIQLEDEGDHVMITVQDDGVGLPAGFDINETNSLGLQIAKNLITEDLQGSLELSSHPGTNATITFFKSIFGGEEGWNESV